MFVQIDDEFVNVEHILRFKVSGNSIVFYLINGKTINWDFVHREQLKLALDRTAAFLKVQTLR